MLAYSAIYGGYDQLTPHPDHPAVDLWVCFTDDPNLTCDGWVTVVEPARFPHPRLSAKWRKAHPPDADRSLWIDGSMRLQGPGLVDAMLDALESGDWALWQHPDRTSIIDEAAVSMTMEKYFGLPVMQQARHYCDQWGWPDDELWASTTMARRHTPQVLQAGAAWFAENEHWTYQDQISLPPVLHRYGINPIGLPYSLWRNPWFKFGPHASNL